MYGLYTLRVNEITVVMRNTNGDIHDETFGKVRHAREITSMCSKKDLRVRRRQKDEDKVYGRVKINS